MAAVKVLHDSYYKIEISPHEIAALIHREIRRRLFAEGPIAGLTVNIDPIGANPVSCAVCVEYGVTVTGVQHHSSVQEDCAWD